MKPPNKRGNIAAWIEWHKNRRRKPKQQPTSLKAKAKPVAKKQETAKQSGSTVLFSFIEGEKVGMVVLPGGAYATVDVDDIHLVKDYRWHELKMRHLSYAITSNGIKMHSLISGEEMTDHRDGNGLNNRRSNLRPCTHAENMRNSRSKQTRGRTSAYKGVHRDRNGKFIAAIRPNRKFVYLGYFCDEKEAAQAYDRAAREYYGEFARLNFPEKIVGFSSAAETGAISASGAEA